MIYEINILKSIILRARVKIQYQLLSATSYKYFKLVILVVLVVEQICCFIGFARAKTDKTSTTKFIAPFEVLKYPRMSDDAQTNFENSLSEV